MLPIDHYLLDHGIKYLGFNIRINHIIDMLIGCVCIVKLNLKISCDVTNGHLE